MISSQHPRIEKVYPLEMVLESFNALVIFGSLLNPEKRNTLTIVIST